MSKSNREWLERCFNCMEPVNTPDEECLSCGWDNHNRENGNAALEQTILKDQYIIGKSIGRGGFGITYVGFDLVLERRVAIKEYFPIGMAYRFSDAVTVRAYTEAEEEFQSGLRQALQESRTIAKLGQIPNIMQVHNAFLENGTVYMVMEYIDGKSLAEEVKQRGRLGWKEALQMMYPVMDALEKLHEKGVIHRDVSPENIIRRTETGEPVLLDFGSARPPREGLTVMLKPGYAPVEQYSQNAKQDGRVDVYALCATMYYLVTGITPASADLRRFAKKELELPSEFAKDLPFEIEEVILKGMELDSNDRYPSMRELHKAFLAAEEQGAGSSKSRGTANRRDSETRRPENKEKTGGAGERQPENKGNPKGTGKVAGIIAAVAAVACLGGFWLFGNGDGDRDTDSGKEAIESTAEESVAKEEKAKGENEVTPTPEQEDTVVAGVMEEPAETEAAAPELTATNAPTPEPIATSTPTPEPTATNTPTPEPTATNTPTPEPTATNTPTPEPTATNTPTPEPTATNTPTPEPTATNTPTPEPTATNTPTPTPTPPVILSSEDLPKMKSDSTITDYIFGSDFYRGEITELKIEKSLSDAPQNAWDISESGDGSVLAWVTTEGEEETLTIAGEGGVRAPEDSSRLFYNYYNLRTVDLTGFDTSNVTNMKNMFAFCGRLKNIDLSGFDTSNVTDMNGMFLCCEKLESIDMSNFDTSNVRDMGEMFDECRKLTSLDVSHFDTSNVTDMNSMFNGCVELTSLDVSHFDTSNVTNMSMMFFGCFSLTSLDVSNFDTSNVTDMSQMFESCENLTSIGVSYFDTANADTTDMYYRCFGLGF